MKLQFTDTELNKLRGLQRSSILSRRQYIKVTILVMLHEGLSVEQVRIFLGIDENTVYRYVGRFREGECVLNSVFWDKVNFSAFKCSLWLHITDFWNTSDFVAWREKESETI